jgi:hemolysin activation/secretion protein
MLGGVDNWLFNKAETRTQETPLGTQGLANRDIFMSEFIGPLRGFSYNKLSGNSHLLLNVELRMPVKSLMSVESSSFLNSLQLVGFTDVGTAWTGSSPFEKSNGFNTNVYGGNTNPFQATVTDFRNPFLMGYGMGARANVFGYFVKFDYAFGLENKEVKSPVTYLTLGYDF